MHKLIVYSNCANFIAENKAVYNSIKIYYAITYIVYTL